MPVHRGNQRGGARDLAGLPGERDSEVGSRLRSELAPGETPALPQRIRARSYEEFRAGFERSRRETDAVLGHLKLALPDDELEELVP